MDFLFHLTGFYQLGRSLADDAGNGFLQKTHAGFAGVFRDNLFNNFVGKR